MAHRLATKPKKHYYIVVIVLALVGVLLVNTLLAAEGTQLRNRSLRLSDPRAGATTTYGFTFQPPSLELIQTIELEVCANDPVPNAPCTAPVGFDASGAVLANQFGDIGFSISPASNANTIILNRPPFSSAGQLNSYEFTNIINPASNGSYYVRIQTFSDGDVTGEATYFGGIAFSINDRINVTATVPPYLLFCVGITVAGFDCNNVTGNYVNFGEFSNRQASLGTTQMLAASNAKDGYNIRVTGTTLTSGTNAIPNMTGSDISRPGIGQFGMNLRANSSPQSGQDVLGSGSGQPTNGYNQMNFYRFNSGDVVASSVAPDLARKYTSSYLVNVSDSQAAGIYVSTLTYITLGSF